MTETTEVSKKEGRPDRFEREYAALSPEDRETVDVVVKFYGGIARDHKMDPKYVKIIEDLAKMQVLDAIAEREADITAE